MDCMSSGGEEEDYYYYYSHRDSTIRLRTKNLILSARALHPRNNDAPSLKMRSSPVNDSKLAIFSPKKTKEIDSAD
uniref:Uncharacterized protein n=1 Tax=Helianthus annuus TaxID=4232 RepID=A0A251V2W3_HELAN